MPLPGRNEPVAPEAPFLQWANGLVKARRTAGVGSFSSHVGWLTEAGRAEDLDEACARAELEQIEVKRSPRDGRDATIQRHWSFSDEIGLYVITTGPVAPTVSKSVKGETARRSAEAGLGVRWPEAEMDGSKGKSRLAIRVLPKPLTDVGYLSPLQITATSLMSEKLLAAVAAHVAACEQAEKILGRAEPLFPGELLLPLGPGEEAAFGKGQSTMVVPMVCRHPKQLDAEYVQAHWRSDAVHTALEQLWPAVQAWAKEYTVIQQDEKAAPAGPPSDLYRPQPDEMELAISQARTQDVLEFLRSHSLDLRDRGDITVEEQAHLAALIEDRLDDLVGGI
jgi:hypothetical protein